MVTFITSACPILISMAKAPSKWLKQCIMLGKMLVGSLYGYLHSWLGSKWRKEIRLPMLSFSTFQWSNLSAIPPERIAWAKLHAYNKHHVCFENHHTTIWNLNLSSLTISSFCALNSAISQSGTMSLPLSHLFVSLQATRVRLLECLPHVGNLYTS